MIRRHVLRPGDYPRCLAAFEPKFNNPPFGIRSGFRLNEHDLAKYGDSAINCNKQINEVFGRCSNLEYLRLHDWPNSAGIDYVLLAIL